MLSKSLSLGISIRPYLHGCFVATLLLFGAVESQAGSFFYWDINGSTAGAGGPAPTGTWNTTDPNFTTDVGGTAATVAYGTARSIVAFSAGADATDSYTVSVAGTIQVDDMHFDDGIVTLAGPGVLDVGSALI